MLTIRKSGERGHADHGWLQSWHTFSFADYMDPQHMGFSVLRVINEDIIQGGGGFPTHGHNDMEIITYVLEGALEHRDSMGNSGIIKPGEVQQMSAGVGVEHSEMNHFADRKAHLLQIWILPNKKGHPPSYDQKSFAAELENGTLVLVASEKGREGSVCLHQDVDLYAAKIKYPSQLNFTVRPTRKQWIQVARGDLQVNGTEIFSGDGAAIQDETLLQIEAKPGAEFLLFDLS